MLTAHFEVMIFNDVLREVTDLTIESDTNVRAYKPLWFIIFSQISVSLRWTLRYGPKHFLLGVQPSVAATIKHFCTNSSSAKGSPVAEVSLEIQNLTFAAASFPDLLGSNSSAPDWGRAVNSTVLFIFHRQPVLPNQGSHRFENKNLYLRGTFRTNPQKISAQTNKAALKYDLQITTAQLFE